MCSRPFSNKQIKTSNKKQHTHLSLWKFVWFKIPYVSTGKIGFKKTHPFSLSNFVSLYNRWKIYLWVSLWNVEMNNREVWVKQNKILKKTGFKKWELHSLKGFFFFSHYRADLCITEFGKTVLIHRWYKTLPQNTAHGGWKTKSDVDTPKSWVHLAITVISGLLKIHVYPIKQLLQIILKIK